MVTFEREVCQLMAEVEQEVVAEGLRQFDLDALVVEVGGQRYRPGNRGDKTGQPLSPAHRDAEGRLVGSMRRLNGVYTQRSSRWHQRVGHLFQGRYQSIVVDKESNLLELSRYVVLNPVREGTVKRVQEWAWSSHRTTAGWG